MQETGNNEILGKKFGTLIFGSGKKIIASFKDFRYTAERYLADGRNHFLYFGDMDYEGIGSFENLAEVFKEKRKQPIYIVSERKCNILPTNVAFFLLGRVFLYYDHFFFFFSDKFIKFSYTIVRLLTNGK